MLVVLTTSGTSANIVRASDVARKMGMTVVAFTGGSGGHLKGNVDFLINVPSDDTTLIQECHIMLGHAICGLVEESMFGAGR